MAASVAALLAGGVTAAQAADGRLVSDNLEGDAAARVEFHGEGDYSGQITSAFEHYSPVQKAHLVTRGEGFAGVAVRSAEPVFYHGKDCRFTAYADIPGGEIVKEVEVNVEVIDADTFAYVAVEHWKKELIVDEWFPFRVNWHNRRGNNNLIFRISLLGTSGAENQLLVDNLEVICFR